MYLVIVYSLEDNDSYPVSVRVFTWMPLSLCFTSVLIVGSDKRSKITGFQTDQQLLFSAHTSVEETKASVLVPDLTACFLLLRVPQILKISEVMEAHQCRSQCEALWAFLTKKSLHAHSQLLCGQYLLSSDAFFQIDGLQGLDRWEERQSDPIWRETNVIWSSGEKSWHTVALKSLHCLTVSLKMLSSELCIHLFVDVLACDYFW